MTTQQAILDAITAYREKHGYSPTVREIARETGIKSTSNVQYYLWQLKAAGLVDWETGKSRTLRVKEKAG